MPSLCPVCQETFVSWVDYHEHVNLSHGVHPTPHQIAANAPKPIEKREWTGPMDKTDKRRVVAKGEARIGRHRFVGWEG
jgi:uncharacterized C2H2 Zn-finger protein